MDAGFHMEIVHRKPGDTRPLPQLYNEALDFIEKMDGLGLDNIWFGEHHFMEKQWNPSPLILIAALARRTSHIRMGVNVLLTPLYQPARLVEDLATLDILTDGRIDMVFGTGSISAEFESFGISPDERHGRAFEFMQLAQRAFQGPEEFDHDGKYFKLPHLRFTTQPVQKPFPIWFGGFGPKNLHRAGKLGFHVAYKADGPYEEGLIEGGHSLDDKQSFATLNAVVVSSKDKIAPLKEAIEPAADTHMADYAKSRDLTFQNVAPSRTNLGREEIFVGTPEMVLQHLEPRLRNSRATHVLGGLVNGHTLNWALRNMESVELYLKEVAPVLRGWGRQPLHKR